MEANEISFYKKLVEQHRGTSMQIGCSETGQEKRLIALISVLENMIGNKYKDLSILDFGCGKGDINKYLDCKRYIGIDAIEENIEDARAKYLDTDFRLLNWDGESDFLGGECVDIIIFSGAFATTNHLKKLQMFSKLLEMSNCGVVGNFLTENKIITDYKNCILTKPNDILEIIDTSKYAVQLKMDYLPHDFTVGCIKWKKLL